MSSFPSQPPQGGVPKPWVFPATVVQDLPSGLRVAATRVGSLPIAQVRWVFGAGRIFERPDRVGSGLLLQRVMRHGTQNLSSRQFAHTLDALGARMGGGVSIDTSVVSIAGLTNHLWRVVDLVTDVALRPGLSDLALAGEKLRTRELHRHACSRTDSIVEMMLSDALYQGHPYGVPATRESGIVETSRSDLVSLHDSIVSPGRGMVYVVGDIDPEHVVRRLAARFSDFGGSDAPALSPPSPPPAAERKVLFVEHPSAKQAHIGVGAAAVARNHPEHLAVRIANQVVGGGATSRLFRVLRDRHGLTYGAYSSLDSGVHAGDITATLSVAPGNTAQAFSALMNEFQRAVEEPPGPEELSHAKQFLMGAFPQRSSGLTGVASLTTAAWQHELPSDVWATFVPRIDAVPEEHVHRALGRWFAPDRCTAVVCGPASCLDGLAAEATRWNMGFERQTLEELTAFVG